jgi:DNA-binding IclR family transcriptional regulator
MLDSISTVGVIDKSVAILEALSKGPRSLSDLVDETGLARPTIHRLAVALETHGLVGRDGDGRFRLGRRLILWGSGTGLAETLVDAAAEVLAALSSATGESAQLFIRDGASRVCIAAFDRPTGLRDTVPVGAVLSLQAGSGAKALMAWASEGESSASATELAQVRRRGWAESVAEREAGVASVSAPVFDGPGVVVAAVGVSGPIDRFGASPGKRFGSAVREAARKLEVAAGLEGNSERKKG